MADSSFLDWPFFAETHRRLARELGEWAAQEVAPMRRYEQDIDDASRELVRRLGAAGWLRAVIPAAYGGSMERLDFRSICIARDVLARVSGLADSAFALQGLGTAPIALHGSDLQKKRYLPPVCEGSAVAAFAISEPEAGSDLAGMQTTAVRDGGDWRIEGRKTWISNAGIADHYIVFCHMPGESGAPRRYGAFIVDAENPGLRVSARIETIAPHPLGTLDFEDCRVSPEMIIGEPGDGMRIALSTLDAFRPTVGAAAVGFARRALDEALARVASRRAFGSPLSDFQLTQARLADMAVAIDAIALLVYRAAWMRDTGAQRTTREAAMAKLFATECAQRVVDDAVQLFGGQGVVAGEPVERLYREVRALRIYEGTSEIQKIVMAGQLLALAQAERAAGAPGGGP